MAAALTRVSTALRWRFKGTEPKPKRHAGWQMHKCTSDITFKNIIGLNHPSPPLTYLCYLTVCDKRFLRWLGGLIESVGEGPGPTSENWHERPGAQTWIGWGWSREVLKEQYLQKESCWRPRWCLPVVTVLTNQPPSCLIFTVTLNIWLTDGSQWHFLWNNFKTSVAVRIKKEITV